MYSAITQTNIPEKYSNIYLGVSIHFGSVLMFILSLFFIEQTIPKLILSIVLSSLPILAAIMYVETYSPVVKLPKLTLYDIINGIKCTFIYGFVLGDLLLYTVLTFFTWLFAIDSTFSITNIIINIIMTDFMYYIIHRFIFHNTMKNKFMKYLHNAHKSHHTNNKLDFIRGNDASIMDASILGFQLFNAIFGVILAMDFRSVFISNMIILLSQIAHHANYTFNISWLNLIFIDSHCHKLHHCIDGYNINYGGIFSFWDELFLTFHEDPSICTNYYHFNKKIIFKNKNDKEDRINTGLKKFTGGDMITERKTTT